MQINLAPMSHNQTSYGFIKILGKNAVQNLAC